MKTAKQYAEEILNITGYSTFSDAKQISEVDEVAVIIIQAITDQSQSHDQEMIVANELIATYQALVELYDKELIRTAVFLSIHGQGTSLKDMEIGKKLGYKVTELLAQFRNQNKEGK